MKPSDWTLESSGELYWTNLSTAIRGKVSDLRNPEISMAQSDYIISGQTVPVPWLLMGQTGAMMGWSGYGRKFANLDDLPARSRTWYEKYHPELFGAAEPWAAYTNAFYGYMAARKPAAP
mgnify:FL=1